MFTGLIEEVGAVAAVRHAGEAARLTVQAPRIGPPSAIGDSISVNGICLTVVVRNGALLEFDAVAETLRRSNLGALRPGDAVNLERAMTAGSRFGGHIVQGHVDAVGQVGHVGLEGTSHRIEVQAPPPFMRYIIEKGSVAVDGISLTVAGLSPSSFTVAIIPHTWRETTLCNIRPGVRVNLEADVLARYVERLLEARLGQAAQGSNGAGLTESVLREQGFA
jgi:riboflavin synthase